MLLLNVIQGPDKGKRFELPDHEPQQIGRSSESLTLSDMTISRRHAELTPDNGQWYLNDLESANGTYVNGERIKSPTLLKPGDQIRTGATIFEFGRAPRRRTVKHPVRVVDSHLLESVVDRTMPSNDDSVIMAVPEPSAEAMEQLKVIYQMMTLVGSEFDRTTLLERVMDLVLEHLEADRGFILIQDSPDAKPAPAVVRYRRKPKPNEDRRIPISRTIVQHVMRRKEGVLSSNAMTDQRFSAGDSIRAYGIRSAICVPVQFRDRVFGVIHIDSMVANYTYTDDQLRLMTAIGAQTGMALANAELYHQGLANARLAATGETVASLSHSIRNMLQGMRGGAEVVEMGLRKKDWDVLGNGWSVLARNLDRIYGLTMNMLAYSKQRKPEFEMARVQELLDEVIQLNQPQCDRREIALITEIDEDMPPVPVDPNGLIHALNNLLANARDAVQSGTGAITLRCEYDAITHTVRLAVADNGAGIEPEAMKQLFDPFYSTKGQQGTGLGLAVTKKIIDEHHGRIECHSKPDEGAEFVIELATQSISDPSATNV